MSSTRRETGFAESVYREYTAVLHRYLARRLARPQNVDDLAQEVFIRLARLSKPELVRQPRAYLCSIAGNLVREFKLRSARERERVVFDSETIEEMAERPPYVRPDELAEHLNVQRQLEQALKRLPPVQCAVLLLARRDGLSHKEIARRTGINVRTVDRYVFEATAKIVAMDWDR
jgi:RNA polymerase sigma factor (sigma-70 family)